MNGPLPEFHERMECMCGTAFVAEFCTAQCADNGADDCCCTVLTCSNCWDVRTLPSPMWGVPQSLGGGE